MFAVSRWSIEGHSLWYSYNSFLSLTSFQSKQLKKYTVIHETAMRRDNGSFKNISLCGKTKST